MEYSTTRARLSAMRRRPEHTPRRRGPLTRRRNDSEAKVPVEPAVASPRVRPRRRHSAGQREHVHLDRAIRGRPGPRRAGACSARASRRRRAGAVGVGGGTRSPGEVARRTPKQGRPDGRMSAPSASAAWRPFAITARSAASLRLAQAAGKRPRPARAVPRDGAGPVGAQCVEGRTSRPASAGKPLSALGPPRAGVAVGEARIGGELGVVGESSVRPARAGGRADRDSAGMSSAGEQEGASGPGRRRRVRPSTPRADGHGACCRRLLGGAGNAPPPLGRRADVRPPGPVETRGFVSRWTRRPPGEPLRGRRHRSTRAAPARSIACVPVGSSSGRSGPSRCPVMRWTV
jgi:hypothetical protein